VWLILFFSIKKDIPFENLTFLGITSVNSHRIDQIMNKTLSFFAIALMYSIFLSIETKKSRILKTAKLIFSLRWKIKSVI
jgi:hypothetical protein